MIIESPERNAQLRKHLLYFSSYQLAPERLTSGYETVYETEIGCSTLLATTGFHRHSGHGAGQVSSPNSSQSHRQVEKAAEHTGN